MRRIVVAAGTVHVRWPAGVQQVLGVYVRTQTDPSASPPHAQPPTAVNYWSNAGPAAALLQDDDGYGATLYGLGAMSEGTEIAVVLKDSQSRERFVDVHPTEYIDTQVAPGHDYYYRLVAVRMVMHATGSVEILSAASDLIRGRATYSASSWR